MGLLVILSSAGIGLFAHFRLMSEDRMPSLPQLYRFGLAVQVATLIMTMALPQDQIWLVIKAIALPIILLFPLATVLTGKVLSDQLSNIKYLTRLQETRQQLALTLKSIGDAVISVDLEGRIQLMNPVAERLTGWPHAEAKGRRLTDIFNIVNGHTRQPVENPVDKVLADRRLTGLANRTILIARDGTEYQIADSASPVCPADGQISGAVMVFRDVTEENRSVAALEESELLFRKLFKEHEAVKLIIDPVSKSIIDANHAAEAFYGWSLEQLKQMDIGQINTLPSEQLDGQMKQALSRSRIRFEFKHRIADGAFRDVEVFSSKICVKGKILLHSIIHDITQRKQAERALMESENRYRSIIMHSPDAIFVNLDGHITIVNNACVQLFGATHPDELIGKTPDDLFGPSLPQKNGEQTHFLENGDPPISPIETQILRLDGTRIDVEVLASAFVVGNSKAIHVILHDVSKRKEKEEEHLRLMAAIEQADEMIVITDTDGAILYVNPAFERITGYAKDKALGQYPRLLKSGEHDLAFYERLWATIKNGDTWRGRFTNRREDGTFYSEEATISPVRNAAGQIVNFVAVKRDISEELQLAKRLDQAQRMESIGTLSSGIAHDFNNLLFPIIGLSELLMEDLPEGSDEHENAEQIYQAGKRASDLVKQILSFSRQAAQEKMPIRIQSVLKEVVKLSRSTIPANISIRQNIQTDCPMVMMDASQLHQVAMNLITNAYHAVENNGGSLFVGLKKENLKETNQMGIALLPGKYAVVTISDTGHGIPESIKDKIFDPYFTTKPQGKGTGLGLSVVYGIVKAAGGDIRVQSEVGKGTQFDLFLPLLESDPEKRVDANETKIPTGNERILLVDDEAAIMRLEQQTLERLGYHVTARSSSLEALEVFRRNPHAFDLVLTDMAMPNMTGEQLAKSLNAFNPNIPIIICTGFSDRINPQRVSAFGVKGILLKPVIKFEMAIMIRKTLDG
ncbi:hypothetical protein JCM12296A_37310 [Desulfosarcina cetonica]